MTLMDLAQNLKFSQETSQPAAVMTAYLTISSDCYYSQETSQPAAVMTLPTSYPQNTRSQETSQPAAVMTYELGIP